MNLDELSRLGAEATPGPWESIPVLYAGSNAKCSWAESDGRVLNGPPQRIEHDTASARWFERKQDCDFIAACTPERIAALVRVAQTAKNYVDARPTADWDDPTDDELKVALRDLEATP